MACNYSHAGYIEKCSCIPYSGNVCDDYILRFVVENEVCKLMFTVNWTNHLIYPHYDSNRHFVMVFAQLLYMRSSEYKVQTLPCLAKLQQVLYCPSALSANPEYS